MVGDEIVPLPGECAAGLSGRQRRFFVPGFGFSWHHRCVALLYGIPLLGPNLLAGSAFLTRWPMQYFNELLIINVLGCQNNPSTHL
jgi:hypothetical protein